jgi:predicted MPP superfamily phosphohydrolase
LSPFLDRTPKGLPRLFRVKKAGATLGRLILCAWFLCLGTAFYGYWVQQGPANVRRVTVASPDLPAKLEGFRIVHLSDFHYGLGSDLSDLDRRLAQAADLRPDLVVVTGDLLDSKSALAADFREPLKRLSWVRFGVYAVLGNHDLYADNPAEETRLLESFGVQVLRNEAVSVGSLPLTIAGFDDPGTRSVFSGPTRTSSGWIFAP